MSREDFQVFVDIKRAKQERRAKRLAATDDFGWSKHSDTHWYRMITRDTGMKEKLHYWPSANKWLYMGRYYRGAIPAWLKELIAADDEIQRQKVI